MSELKLKFLFLGDAGVGKTGIFKRFADDAFNRSYLPSIGVDFRICDLDIDGKRVRLQLWDSSGQDRFRNITMSYIRGAQGLILVFDVTHKGSFENLSKWLQDVRKFCSEQIPILVIGNRIDKQDKRQVEHNAAKAFANSIGATYAETSAYDGTNVKDAITEFTRTVAKAAVQEQGHSSEAGEEHAEAAPASPPAAATQPATATAEKARAFHIHSPLVVSEPLSRCFGKDVLLKVDVVQPSGSFKIRGIGRTCQEAIDAGKTHLVSSSGGNAGNAVAYAGQQMHVKVTVVVPSSTAESVRERIASFGAEVIVHGDVWDEADQYARELAQNPECAYVHPFGQETTWEGHTTIVEELKHDMPQKPGLIVVSVGGGGLLLGITRGLDKVGWSDVPVLAMETEGANSLNESVKSGSLVTLGGITSIAKTLGAKRVAEAAFKATKTHKVHSGVVSDKECMEALCSFADDQRMLVEPACAAALSPIYNPDIARHAGVDVDALQGPVVVVVCGGSGVSFRQICEWRQQVGLSAL